MPKEMLIMRATPFHVPQIIDLVDAYTFERRGVKGSLLPVKEFEVSSLIDQGSFFVAFREDDFVGCVSLREYDGIAEVRSLAVKDSHQFKKIGSMLIRQCVETAYERRYDNLYALTKKGLGHVFESNGFKYTAVIPDPKIQRDCLKCPLYRISCNEEAYIYTMPNRSDEGATRLPGL